MAVLAGIGTFTVIRLRQDRTGKDAGRFFGSHTRAAWPGVIATLLLYQGRRSNTGCPS